MFRATVLSIILCCLMLPALGQQDTLNKLDKNGKKHGYWVRYENDTLTYEGRFDHGTPTGLFVYYYPDKQVKSTVEYANKGLEARTVMYHASGAIMAVGKYVEQKKDSVWKYYSELEILVSEEKYNHGKAHGEWLNYDGTGQVIEKIHYADGIKQGEWIQYFDGGKVKLKGTYKDDFLDGSFLLYYSNGMFCVAGKYEKSIPAGTWVFYNFKGEVERKETYLDGKKVKTEQLLPSVEPDSPEAKKEIEVMRRQMQNMGIDY